ncbi:MAG TPA: DUF1326 domain-containing protein [Steroidobacter sp.]|uniref:DUF1326 domain-containing protein n=1 Tax=Steroidobacter sp. TaxID=1978227 RepID=UPI002ED8BF23
MSDVQKWSLQGQWFDVCRCAIPCPCSWAQPPDDGFCEGILIWHIQKGHYGTLTLDGLNVAMLGSFRGNVWEKASDFKDAIFMDERADDGQRAALQTVFSGHAGGWPKRFGELVQGEHVGFAFAPIEVQIAPDLSTWKAEIRGHDVLAAAEALMGPTSDGKVTKIHNLPGAETGPGGVATWGRATTDRANAFGFKWDRTGKSSKLIAFEWAGPD